MITRSKMVPRKPFGILDVGSSKLACLIAQKSPTGELKLLGQSMHACEGVKQGEITDMNKFSTTIGKTVNAAERNADTTIATVHIVTPGGMPQLETHTSSLELYDDIVSRHDIARLLYQQSQVSPPSGQFPIQRQSGLYQLDDHKHIENPLGMCGRILGIEFTILSLSQTSYTNLRQAVQQCHLDLASVHHSAVMSSYACLSDDDRDLGTLLIDFGGGTTSLALFAEGQLRHAGTIRMGGMNITRDIAKMLSISVSDAERLKAIEGSVLPTIIKNEHLEHLSFPSHGDNFVLSNVVAAEDNLTLSSGQVIQRQFLSDIIRTRCEEILEAIDAKLCANNLGEARTYNLALTGGASQLTGMSDFASEFWGKPAVLRSPIPLSGPDGKISGSSFSACMGLVRFLHSIDDQNSQQNLQIQNTTTSANSVFGRLGTWFKENA